MNKPPPSNLGPAAEPWARWFTDQTEFNVTAIERMGGDATNDGRINNSALDNMAGQINELYTRQAVVYSLGSLSTPTMTATGGNQVVTTSLAIPIIDTPRWGWLAISATPAVTPPLDTSLFVTYTIDGAVFYRSSAFFPIMTTVPSGWDYPTFLGATGFQGISGGNTLGIRLEADPDALGTAGNRVASLQNITVTVNYAQPL